MSPDSTSSPGSRDGDGTGATPGPETSTKGRGHHLSSLSTDPLDVLVIEDDPVARTYLTETLTSRGHAVESLESGDEAAERFRESEHELIFLDRSLPGVGGVEICRRIREIPASEDTIIVFVTVDETQQALDEALRAGADDYVVKPVSPDLLHTRIAIAERRVEEIRDHRRIQEELRRETYRDGLTGLGNREKLEDQIEKSVGRIRRAEDYLFAVLLIDVDGFHGINQEYGAETADRVLQEVGSRLEQCVRGVDTVSRIAADEFGIHLEDLKNESDPTRVAGRIQQSLTPPTEVEGRRIHASACIGIALGSKSSTGAEEMLRDAGKALTRAKSRGRGEVQVFDPGVHARAMARVALEAEIRQALEKRELSLHYQPILELETGRIDAVEALLRWEREDGELTLPSTFIPVAEETGLIVPLGWWTLETACRQAREWRDAFPGDPPLRVSVNVSSRQFAQPDMQEIVARTLERTGLPGDALHLELTETAVMKEPDTAVETLAKLRELGVHLHVDDFGTGYSSLAYLCRLPIDSLKVDRAFIDAMTETRENLEVVRTIVHLARNLGLTVIGEGVETEEQEALLREMQCDFVQGYRYHRPMGVERIGALLEDQG